MTRNTLITLQLKYYIIEIIIYLHYYINRYFSDHLLDHYIYHITAGIYNSVNVDWNSL